LTQRKIPSGLLPDHQHGGDAPPTPFFSSGAPRSGFVTKFQGAPLPSLHQAMAACAWAVFTGRGVPQTAPRLAGLLVGGGWHAVENHVIASADLAFATASTTGDSDGGAARLVAPRNIGRAQRA